MSVNQINQIRITDNTGKVPTVEWTQENLLHDVVLVKKIAPYAAEWRSNQWVYIQTGSQLTTYEDTTYSAPAPNPAGTEAQRPEHEGTSSEPASHSRRSGRKADRSRFSYGDNYSGGTPVEEPEPVVEESTNEEQGLD